MAELNLGPSLGIPVVPQVDDEEVMRDALAWLLRSRQLPPPPAIFLAGHGDMPTAAAAVERGSREVPGGR
jgi:hypothetical protein